MIYYFDHSTVKQAKMFELGNVRVMNYFFKNNKDKFELN